MDEDIVDNENNIDAADNDAADNDAAGVTAVKPVQGRKRFGFLAPVLGLFLALAAGGIGGYAAHNYFQTPPPVIDLSSLHQDIESLEDKLKAQTARVSKIETQNQKESARLAGELSKLEGNLKSGLADIESQINAAANQKAALSRTDIKADDKDIDSPAFEADGAFDSNRSNADILTLIDNLRGDVDKDLKAVKTRLKRLEDRPVERAANNTETDRAITAVPSFPADEILAKIKAGLPPETAQNWWDKVLRKHVSLKRTDHDAAAAILKDVEAAILTQDWAQATRLAQALPEPAQASVKEWIARARR